MTPDLAFGFASKRFEYEIKTFAYIFFFCIIMSFFFLIHIHVFLFCFATVDLLFRFVFQLLLFFKTSLQEGRGKGVIRDNMETRLFPKFLYICRVFSHFLSRVHLSTKPTLHPTPTPRLNNFTKLHIFERKILEGYDLMMGRWLG